MWVIKQKSDDSFYLTYDRTRSINPNLRGIWEWVGKSDNLYTAHCVKVNEQQGLICAKDDEGNTRVLILTE